MPPPLRLVAGSLLVTGGLALLVVALLGARSRLRRNRFAGVRTSATLRSDAAFTLANRAAAMPIGAAGVVAAAGGSVLLASGLLASGPGSVGWVVLAVAVVGCLGLTGLGGVVGDRVAADLAARAPEPRACGGACAGCDLAAGCRPDP
ncbi:MAG: SdpI family protein [Pseudonocardia sp.]